MMKIAKSIIMTCGSFAFGLASVNVQAQSYEAGNWKVVGYRTGADGSLFTLSPAPQACAGGSNHGEHIRIVDNAANRQEIVASLMTAYLTGEKLSGIWFSNSGPCSTSAALSVFMIRMASK